jgi:hypothetical protein
MGMVACSSDKEIEEGYNMNDIVGKWVGYKWVELAKNPNTEELEIIDEYVMKNSRGEDSLWVEAFYEDGTHAYLLDEYVSSPKNRYEVKGNILTFYEDNQMSMYSMYIDELTQTSMKLRLTKEIIKDGGKRSYNQFVYGRMK